MDMFTLEISVKFDDHIKYFLSWWFQLLIHKHFSSFETLIRVYVIHVADNFKYIYICPVLNILHSCKLHIVIDSYTN